MSPRVTPPGKKVSPAPDLGSYEKLAAWLRALNYIISTASLHEAVHAGTLSRDSKGQFDPTEVLAFAEERSGRIDAGKSLHQIKLQHTIRQLKAKADRQEIAAARERGDLIDRHKVEREFAARAIQLRSDFESWAHEVPLRIVDRWDLGAEAIGELRNMILEAGKEWFGRYTEPIEFVTQIPTQKKGKG